MLVMHNRDVPGVIGRVGTILGEQGINISAFHLGRRERGGEAMAVIEIDAGVEQETIAALRALPEILTVREITLIAKRRGVDGHFKLFRRSERVFCYITLLRS